MTAHTRAGFASRISMAVLAFAVMLATAALAVPATEADYLALRDRHLAYFAKFASGSPTPRDYDAEAAARTELQGMLQSILGRPRIRGFAGQGRIALETLMPEKGIGRLDGLEWSSHKPDVRLVITTDALLTHWLASGEWLSRLPKERTSLLRSSDFFADALFVDISFRWYAEIPVRRKAGASLTAAFLGAASPDELGPAIPDRIEIVVVRDGRIYLVDAASRAIGGGIASCVAISKSYEERTWAPYTTSKFAAASPVARKAMVAERSRLYLEGDLAMRKCYAANLPMQPFFQSLVAEAQSFVDRVATD